MNRHPLRSNFTSALPFWISLAFVPIVALAGWYGGLFLALPPVFGWYVTTLLDFTTGRNEENPDPDAPTNLFWYRLITLIWLPVQIVLVYGAIYYATHTDRLDSTETVIFMMVLGVATGSIGIVYGHELMHQSPKWERFLGDGLTTMALYGHFRSEHLLVHHRHVGTPRDPVSARYNEGFHRFFPRVLIGSLLSSFRAERDMLARKALPWWHRTNPFWRYVTLEFIWLFLAWLVGGWIGVGLFLLQAFIAVWQLELTNYVEHYGLTRRHLGNGKYEHVQPHHSWNSSHRVTNYFLINLQRHSDHHYKPARRFPLLQTYSEDEAPQLPFGYPLMTMLAMTPPLWRRYMNPKVRAWRRKYYPDITDWHPYNKALNPPPG